MGAERAEIRDGSEPKCLLARRCRGIQYRDFLVHFGSSPQGCAAKRTPPGPISPGYGALHRQKVPLAAPSK